MVALGQSIRIQQAGSPDGVLITSTSTRPVGWTGSMSPPADWNTMTSTQKAQALSEAEKTKVLVFGFLQDVKNHKSFKPVQRHLEFANRTLKIISLYLVYRYGSGINKAGKIGQCVILVKMPISGVLNLQKWVFFRVYVGNSDDSLPQRILKQVCPLFLCFGGANGLFLWGIEMGGLAGFAIPASVINLVSKLTGHVVHPAELLAKWNAIGGWIGHKGKWCAFGLMASRTANNWYTSKTYQPHDPSNAAEVRALNAEIKSRREDPKSFWDSIKYFCEANEKAAPTKELGEALKVGGAVIAWTTAAHAWVSKDLLAR